MSQIAIKRVNDDKKSLPVFEEIAKRIEAVQQRAFEFFKQRNFEPGHDLEDWLRAEQELGWPAVELAEKDHAYEIQVTLPDFEAKDVEVTATPNELILHAATEQQKKTKKGDVLWTESGSNDVYRRFELSKPIDVDKVAAKIEKGILHVTAPKIVKVKEISKAAA